MGWTGDVVWSVVLMVIFLCLAVSALIYYIIRYDYYFPNDLTDSHDAHASHGQSH